MLGLLLALFRPVVLIALMSAALFPVLYIGRTDVPVEIVKGYQREGTPLDRKHQRFC